MMLITSLRSHFLFPWISLAPSVCLSLSLPISFSVSLSFSLSVSFVLFFSVCLPHALSLFVSPSHGLSHALFFLALFLYLTCSLYLALPCYFFFSLSYLSLGCLSFTIFLKSHSFNCPGTLCHSQLSSFLLPLPKRVKNFSGFSSNQATLVVFCPQSTKKASTEIPSLYRRCNRGNFHRFPSRGEP